MYSSMLSYPGMFADFDRLTRDLDDLFAVTGMPTSIRSAAPGAFPAINIGNTQNSVEIYVFAPGMDAKEIDVTIDRGVLTVSGERKSALPENGDKANVYGNERFAGKFRRAVSLPEDVDPGKCDAKYRDGVLHITLTRRESAQPKRINVQ